LKRYNVRIEQILKIYEAFAVENNVEIK